MDFTMLNLGVVSKEMMQSFCTHGWYVVALLKLDSCLYDDYLTFLGCLRHIGLVLTEL